MYKSQKVAVVMPAYNAERTLRETYHGVVEQNIADIVIVVDDCSNDNTEREAQSLPHQNPDLVYGPS